MNNADQRKLALAAAGPASAAAAALALAGLGIPAAICSIAALGLFGFVIRPERTAQPDERLLERAAEQAATGRRLAIYERETGLFAYWYLLLRGEEECKRANRYARSLSLLIIEATHGSGDSSSDGSLIAWMDGHLRATDIAGYLGNRRFLVLMPETEPPAATEAMARLLAEHERVEAALVSWPADGETFEALYATALARLAGQAEQAA